MFMRKVYLTLLALSLFSITKICAQKASAITKKQEVANKGNAGNNAELSSSFASTQFSATKANPPVKGGNTAGKNNKTEKVNIKKEEQKIAPSVTIVNSGANQFAEKKAKDKTSNTLKTVPLKSKEETKDILQTAEPIK